MKKILKSSCFLAVLLMGTVSINAKILEIDYFDTKSYVNSLGGRNDVWIGNPGDTTISCKSDLKKEKRGYSLKISYDLDSAITYMGGSTYIMDYSEYTTIGYAPQVPHTAFGGFYFLIKYTDLTKYNYIVFYARGDEEAGYTRRFKLELKTDDQSSSYIVDGVTDKWKKFVIPLSVFDSIDNWKKITELTIVLLPGTMR